MSSQSPHQPVAAPPGPHNYRNTVTAGGANIKFEPVTELGLTTVLAQTLLSTSNPQETLNPQQLAGCYVSDRTDSVNAQKQKFNAKKLNKNSFLKRQQLVFF